MERGLKGPGKKSMMDHRIIHCLTDHGRQVLHDEYRRLLCMVEHGRILNVDENRRDDV